jgi:protein-S-isoprenylcysteine O-methyltransferase Ste14
MNLAMRTLKSSVSGLIVVGLLLFVPAGTFAYWQGWLFIAVFTASTTLISLYLAAKDPALLERRLRAGPGAETRPLQKRLMQLLVLSFMGIAVLSALDVRFGWSHVPVWVSLLGELLVVLGLLITVLVFRENTYTASTVRTMEGQTVISTGPYALVRHPMYVGVLVMTVGSAPALGSYWALLFVLAVVPILMLRIRDEESLLRTELPGYEAYAQKVRYRLLPGLW